MSARKNDVCAGCPAYCCVGFGHMLVSSKELGSLPEFKGLKREVEGNLFRVAVAGEKEHCPYLVGYRCSNYEMRPLDCQLYPAIIEETKEINETIVAFYSFHRRCPQVKFFKSSWAKSNLEKMRVWLQNAYPDKRVEIVYRRTSILKKTISRLNRILETLISLRRFS
jgi:Fe-S-cluster containining protein